MDSTSNNFYFTGFQVEVGDKATPFEHEDIGTTLRKCQRYFELIGYGIGRVVGTTQLEANSNFKVDKRAAPTIALKDTTTAIAEYLMKRLKYYFFRQYFLSLPTHCGNRLTSSDTAMNNGSLAGIIKEDALSADAEL